MVCSANHVWFLYWNATLGWNGLKENIHYCSFANRTQNSSENSKPFWRLHLRGGSVGCPTSNGEGFSSVQHSMSMVLDMRFHIWFIMTLHYKMQKILLQIVKAILLQNVTVCYKCIRFFITKCDSFITNCNSYYKLRQFYYKMQQLLRIIGWFLGDFYWVNFAKQTRLFCNTEILHFSSRCTAPKTLQGHNCTFWQTLLRHTHTFSLGSSWLGITTSHYKYIKLWIEQNRIEMLILIITLTITNWDNI